MRSSRWLSLLCVCGALLLLADAAQARSSRGRSSRSNRSGDRGGRYRLIEGDDERRREERRKEEEQKREEARRKAEERRMAEEAKRKEREEAAKARREAMMARSRPQPRPQPAESAASSSAVDKEKREEEAAKIYEEAEAEFEENELLPGVKLLRECIKEHEGTEAAKRASARLDQLLGLEPYGPVILLGEAEEFFSAQRYRRAHYRYNQLLKAFPDSEQAAAAKQRLAEIQQGDLLSKTVYTDEELEDARFWLLVGNIHLENGRGDEAMAAYRKVMEDFAGCRYAKEAAERLAAALAAAGA